MTNKPSQFKYETSLLDKYHDKKSFSCGLVHLDKYLKERAGQDGKKNVSVTYVLTLINSHKILGYYTLSSTGIIPGDLPQELTQKLPRYPVLPAILLGRLAVDKKFQGNKIGACLLLDALKRSLKISDQIGAMAVLVDAKDDNAADFYKYFGFKEFPRNNNKLFLPMDTIMKLPS